MNSANDIYRAAIEKYGADSQILMVMEEMAELQKELCKNRRGAENSESIAEEIADVEIMLEQMKLLFDIGDQVEKCRDYKTLRLKARLEEDKSGPGIVHCEDCAHLYVKDFSAFCPFRVDTRNPEGFCERGERRKPEGVQNEAD